MAVLQWDCRACDKIALLMVCENVLELGKQKPVAPISKRSHAPGPLCKNPRREARRSSNGPPQCPGV